MRRSASILLMAALSLAVSAGPAAAGPDKQQSVRGSVLLSTPTDDDAGCYAGLHRRGAIVAGSGANGVSGYDFEVEPTTIGTPFVLEPTGGQGYVDLDIYFYIDDFGTLGDVLTDPLSAGAPETVSFNTREAGGEANVVPDGAKRVIVCMYGGQHGVGVAATFLYRAGRGVKEAK